MSELLTVTEAADLLRVHPRTIARWCDQGDLDHVRLPSGRLRIRRVDLDALLVQQDTT